MECRVVKALWTRCSVSGENSAFYLDSESLVRALQELPLSLRLNVAAELVQSTVPLELPQVKPKRPDDSKGTGMQLKGSLSELRSAACPGPLGPSSGPQKPASSPESAADHLEEELDLLLNLDAPVKEEDNLLGKTSQDLKPEEDGEMAQEEKGTAWPPSLLLLCDPGGGGEQPRLGV
uniref:Uncharacterized protein n=1 Tax=Oryctolagus cuniculus TaxID=9986 RepID=A0A5F9DAG3_RABIT